MCLEVDDSQNYIFQDKYNWKLINLIVFIRAQYCQFPKSLKKIWNTKQWRDHRICLISTNQAIDLLKLCSQWGNLDIRSKSVFILFGIQGHLGASWNVGRINFLSFLSVCKLACLFSMKESFVLISLINYKICIFDFIFVQTLRKRK